MLDKTVNVKQRLFCIEFLKDFNATQAALRAGYSKKTAFAMGCENLKKPNIQQELSVQIEEMLIEAKIPLKKLLLDYWIKRAFYDVTEIINMDGTIKLTEKQLREKGLHVCIDGIEKRINAKGESYVKYRFADKDKAADMLQRYIQMIKDEPQPVQQNNTYIDLKALIFNQVKNPKEKERIIAGLEKLSNYQE